jgi:hypothetical protein
VWYVLIIGDKAYLRVETKQTGRRGFRENTNYCRLGHGFIGTRVIEGCPSLFGGSGHLLL